MRNVLMIFILLCISHAYADSTLDNKLIEATKEGDISSVKSLIEKGANPNADLHKPTPLYEASWRGNLEMVKTLFAAGAKLDVKDSSLLQAAACGHSTGLMDFLSKKGYKLDGKVLVMAVYCGQPDIVDYLLKAGVDPNFKGNKETPLSVAITLNKYAVDPYTQKEHMINSLVKAGAKDADSRGNTWKGFISSLPDLRPELLSVESQKTILDNITPSSICGEYSFGTISKTYFAAQAQIKDTNGSEEKILWINSKNDAKKAGMISFFDAVKNKLEPYRTEDGYNSKCSKQSSKSVKNTNKPSQGSR